MSCIPVNFTFLFAICLFTLQYGEPHVQIELGHLFIDTPSSNLKHIYIVSLKVVWYQYINNVVCLYNTYLGTKKATLRIWMLMYFSMGMHLILYYAPYYGSFKIKTQAKAWTCNLLFVNSRIFIFGLWCFMGRDWKLHSTLHGTCLPCTTHVHRHDNDNQIKNVDISRESTAQSKVIGPYVVTLLDWIPMFD